ncbi:leucine-rich repeat-containing protein 39-like [Lethenteron reissneri]|uniref:leucine-rich repeat-containing protein 39-like n=1 Tax=Lethenteron reissneri TaxID=7753 RepID=UPI002AB6BC62|nr:leucine-rich repeat-containing protein 39-like [Lethenteron reissneri]
MKMTTTTGTRAAQRMERRAAGQASSGEGGACGPPKGLEGLAGLRALWERRIRATTEEVERQRCNRERRSLGRLSAAWEHRISVAKLREMLVTVDGRVVLKVLKLDWENVD